MSQAPRLLSLATAVPDHLLDQREVEAAAGRLFGRSFDDFSRLAPVYANSQIATRHSCVALDWYQHPHGFAERNRLYLENAIGLLEHAALDCLETAGLEVADVDAVVTVSSTGISTPSLDALLMERLPLRRTVVRLPVFGLGCAGGVLGLARAAELALARPGRRVLLLVVELCGLTFRAGDHTKSNVIATALFGDGAAAALIACDGTGPELTHWGEHTWPGTLDVMGWDIRDDGLAVVFSRDIPSLVLRHMRAVTEAFLAEAGLALRDIDWFLCHPGGAKVVESLESAYGLEPGALGETRAVLREHGNMSAPTVLFVLAQALGRGAGGRFLLTALGPGFTAAFAVLEGR